METKLKAGTTLIVDRYSYSGVAFSSAKGLDTGWCKVKSLHNDMIFYTKVILGSHPFESSFFCWPGPFEYS